MKNKDNTEKYKDDFTLLHESGVGIALTRTREPSRVEVALREWCMERGKTCNIWNLLQGCTNYGVATRPMGASVSVDPEPKPIANTGLVSLVIKQMLSTERGTGSPFNDAVTLFVWPHHEIGKVPAVQEGLRQMSRMFPSTGQRAVLVVPEDFELPKELENDIPLLDFGLPTLAELKRIFVDVVDSKQEGLAGSAFSNDDMLRLTTSGKGMTEMQFENAIAQTIITHEDTFPNTDIDTLNKTIFAAKTEVVKRSDILELMPSAKLEDIGGLELFKDYLARVKVAYSEGAREHGVDRPKGIALVGPFGTGKSLCGKVAASCLGINAVKMDIGRILNKYVGGSESRLRAALTMLEAMAPCVCFVDEIDKSLGSEGKGGEGSSGGVTGRLMATLLNFMQESDAEILWMFTMNDGKAMNAAMMRMGRIDAIFSMLPPTRQEREVITSIHLNKRNHDPKKIAGLDKFIDATEGWVSAEIEAIVSSSILESYCLNSKLSVDIMLSELKQAKPLCETYPEQVNKIKEWSKAHARPSSAPEGSTFNGTAKLKRVLGSTQKVKKEKPEKKTKLKRKAKKVKTKK